MSSPRDFWIHYDEVRAFADWWGRVCLTSEWVTVYWMDALAWWLEPKYPDGVHQMWVLYAFDELQTRGLLNPELPIGCVPVVTSSLATV